MASVPVFPFLLFFHLVLLAAGHGNGKHDKCPKEFECGPLGSIHFPFTKAERPECGFIAIDGCDDPPSKKTIQLEKNGTRLWLKKVLQKRDDIIITVFDEDLHERLKSCEVSNSSITLPPMSPLASFIFKHNETLFRCKKHGLDHPNRPHFYLISDTCPDFDIFCHDSLGPHPPPLDDEQNSALNSACSGFQLPCKCLTSPEELSSFSWVEIDIQVQLTDECVKCYNQKDGQCQVDSNNKFVCRPIDAERGHVFMLGLVLGLLIGVVIIPIIICRLYKQRNIQKNASSNVQLQSANSNTVLRNSNTDLESGMAYFGIPLFSYEELEKATDNFDHSKELGNGGFGTVYYGKLQDGREVAVKRLNDHNYRQIQQFINEVNILTRLRHRNLVSLYGCTSRRCHELLLVYEYIPNGTLSCHLHGELANRGLLPWPIRMKIAIETASALAYLHASDTIHRDVKTNNILLENNFSIKVADFGLSRLFPNNVTHVSTAPQGTPGYVDPEYYHCYQLTNKSDVYSFGVILIELISSLPAVDIKRARDEINLANLAIKKIQKSAFRELVDPSLGFDSDNEVRRMIVSVAELAFQCLKGDRELRPSMVEVLEMLRRIESGTEEHNHVEEVDFHGVPGISHSGPIHPSSPPSPDCDEATLLKNTKSLPSPKGVTAKWHTESMSSNVSA